MSEVLPDDKPVRRRKKRGGQAELLPSAAGEGRDDRTEASAEAESVTHPPADFRASAEDESATPPSAATEASAEEVRDVPNEHEASAEAESRDAVSRGARSTSAEDIRDAGSSIEASAEDDPATAHVSSAAELARDEFGPTEDEASAEAESATPATRVDTSAEGQSATPELRYEASAEAESRDAEPSSDEASAEAESATTAAAGPPDTIEHQGQRLRRVSPRQLALEKRALDKAAPPRRPPPPPPEDDEADDIVLEEPRVNARGELPDEDEDEPRREGVTVSDIEAADGTEFPDTAGRGPPRTLPDVFGTYPIGNGQHYVRVERLKPQIYLGIPCAGYMGDLTRPMTESDFRLWYGGGRYELVVFGPDPRGRHDPVTGQPIIKALTKPIYVQVPGNPTQETLVGDPGPGKRGSGMFPPFESTRRGPPPTTADAAMHRDTIGLAQGLLAEERREKRELQKELQAGQHRGVEPVLSVVREASKESLDMVKDELARTRALAEKEMDRKEEELRALRREVEASRQKPTESEGAWKALSQVATSLAPGRSSTEELSRIHESHRDEVRRLEDQHRRELTDVRAGFDDRVKILQAQIDSERGRAREEVRDVTDRLERREKDAREAFEARIKDQREHFEQRERDTEARHRGELERTRGEHERELRSQAQQHELVRTTDKQGQESRIAQMKDRIDILKEEVDRWKGEANNKADWAEQMAEFEKKAEAIGFQKADAGAPQTWQERITAAIADVLRNADKISANIGGAIRDRKEAAIAQAHTIAAYQQAQAQQGQQAQQQGVQGALPPGPGQQAQQGQQRVIRGPGGRPVQATRQVWATEDMPMAPPPGAQGVPVTHPDSRQAPEAVVMPSAAAAPPPEAPPSPPPPPPPQAAPPPPQAAQQPQQPQPPQQAQIDPAMLETFRLWAESEITNKRDPAEFGRNFVERVGAPQAWEILSRIEVDVLFEALSSTPATLSSAILTHGGQAFMRRAWAEARSVCRKALGVPEPE